MNKQNQILNVLKDRDAEFINKFCTPGTYLDNDGNTINGICRPVDPSETLNLIHVYDALIIDIIKD